MWRALQRRAQPPRRPRRQVRGHCGPGAGRDRRAAEGVRRHEGAGAPRGPGDHARILRARLQPGARRRGLPAQPADRQTLVASGSRVRGMKLATWNVNSLKVRLPQVLEWAGKHRPDVLCLQETKLQDEQFPAVEIRATGYEPLANGQKTYNGVCIVSLGPPSETITEIPGLEDSQKRGA